MQIDSITRSVIVNNLQWATEEMNEYMARSAYSSNIKVRKDCSCALYDRYGNILAQGTFIPVHLGIMSQTLKELLKLYPEGTLQEGDAIIHNDPYMMGSHLFDVMIFRPVFYQNELIAFTGVLAHQVDIGGSPVLYIWNTIHEEGLRLPGIKIIRQGELQEDIVRIITSNVRTPYEVNGDLMAQLAASYRGEQRIIELAKKYGLEKIQAYFQAILDYSEQGMRHAIGNLPDGETCFEDYLESDGKNEVMIKLKAKVIIKGSDIFVDFNGTDAPGEGGFNNPLSLTYSGVYYAVKAVLGSNVPTNAGAYRAVHIVPFESETILNAQYPHAVAGCTSVATQRVADIVIGALSRIVPEKACACDGHWCGITYGGVDPRNGRYFSYVETYGCGRGAKHNQDGASAHQTHMTNTANAPIEMIELEYPFVVEEYSLANDSGGAGKFRGGLGIIRKMRCLTDTFVSVIAVRRRTNPYGLEGGNSGRNDTAFGIFPDGSKHSLVSEKVPAGTLTVLQTSGGGGWGSAEERDPEAIAKDIENNYISEDAARSVYHYFK